MAGVKRKSLLDEEDDDHNGVGNQVTLKVNKVYAERFEHNKRREDLHRLQELQKKGIGLSDGEDSNGSSEGEEEDEDGLLPERVNLQIFETLAKIRKKDPSIYSSDAKFYDEEEDGEESHEEGKGIEKKKKPLYLKDVIAKQLLEDDGPDAKEVPVKPGPGKSYVQEQQELKRAFLESVTKADVDDADGLFLVRKKTKEELEKETEETVAEGDETRKDVGAVIEEYFGNDTDLDENERFLKSYIQNQGWIDRESRKEPSFGDIDVGEDDEEVEKQDRFEAEYNFRYQDEDGFQVQGCPRILAGSVRKKPDQRKKQRLSKQERLTEQERARQEEVKRLKNVKRNELLEKLEQIRSIAGADEEALAALGEDDLEEDFNPDEYDKKMAEAFGDAYYGGHDVDDRFNKDDADDFDEMDDMEKPDFEAEDELLGLPEGWDSGAKTGFSAVYAKQKKVDIDGTASSAGEKKTLKMSLKDKMEFEKKMEEYYKLDYEDVVGDLPTRFKYTKVKRNLYGLRTKDILNTDDQDLNQYVSLKKLAPYRTEEWKVPRHLRQQRFSRKDREKRSLDVVPSDSSSAKELKSNADAHGAPASTSTGMGLDSTESVATKAEKGSQPNGKIAEQGNEIISKSKKKRRRQKGPQLPMSRLLAYRGIQPPPKKQKKQKVAPSN